jgi:radical SAM protein with 4Fe4S-binding SPASM domain
MASSALEQQTPIVINKDFALAGIKDAIEGKPTGIHATVLRFFSPGEPTQCINLMRDCVEFSKKMRPSIQVELQTNGVFNSECDTGWVADNCDVVWFSLDGPAYVNDYYRPDARGNGSTKQAEDNLKVVMGKTNVGVRSTVDLPMFDKQDEMVQYYYDLGIRNLALNPITTPVKRGDISQQDINKDDPVLFAKGFIKAYKLATKLGVDLTNSMTFNFDEETVCGCRSCIPMPQLNPDGTVSSCDLALYADIKPELQCFLYGKWDPNTKKIEYDFEKIKYLANRTLVNLPNCRECEIGEYCAGGCAGRVAFQTGDIYGIIPDICEAIKYMAKHISLGKRQIKFTHP